MLTTRRLASETVFSTLAICIERMTYYGTRSLLLIYLVNGALHAEKAEASAIIGLFTSAILLSRIFGGLISDLLLGTKWGMIAGAWIQALGFGCLALEWKPLVIAGLILFVLGNVLYVPATYARLGRAWLSRPEKMDGVFSIAYIAIMIGSFLAPLLIGSIGRSWGFSFGFTICAGLMVTSSALFFILPNEEPSENTAVPVRKKNPVPLLLIAGTVLLAMIYWTFREFASFHMNDCMQHSLHHSGMNNAQSLVELELLPLLFFAIASMLFTILWFFVKVNTFMKIGVGVLLTGIGYLLFQTWGLHTTAPYTPFLLASIPIGIGEALFPAVIFSVIAQKAPPKYLATIIGASSIFIGYLSKELFALINQEFPPNESILDTIACVLAGIGLAIVLVVQLTKRRPSATENQPLDTV